MEREGRFVEIFLAGIIQGSLIEAEIHDQGWRERICHILSRHVPHANVYCHYSRHPDSIGYDLARVRETIEEGIRRAARCDVLVAYCPSASMGTAIEIYEAARNGAVVLTISPLKANWVLRAYSDRMFDSIGAFEAFLGGDGLEGLAAAKKRC
jgi:hypothetical protein